MTTKFLEKMSDALDKAEMLVTCYKKTGSYQALDDDSKQTFDRYLLEIRLAKVEAALELAKSLSK